MPLIASNIIFAPPPASLEPKQQSIVVSGSDWRNQISKQIDVSNTVVVINDAVEPPATPKPKNSRKKSEKLIEYRDSPFLNDMLSINKE